MCVRSGAGWPWLLTCGGPDKDRHFPGSLDEYVERLRRSATCYVGNLSFQTTEEQIYELFGKAGALRCVVMGLDKVAKTPCGFCFVEYTTRREAEDCVKFLNGARLDDRDVRIDFDWGFEEGRQYGRGKSGGQVRDEYRVDYDTGRGGYGQLVRDGLKDLQGKAAPAGAGAKRPREETGNEQQRNPRFRGE